MGLTGEVKHLSPAWHGLSLLSATVFGVGMVKCIRKTNPNGPLAF